MRDAEFTAYMQDRNLAEKTIQQRGYALKRIERAYGIDLDEEASRDGLASLLQSLTYSANDERAARVNPSRLDIDADKLLTHLRWYKSHMVDYARFAGRLDSDSMADQPEVTTADAIVEEAVAETFGLERDLQLALRSNLEQLELGLVVADGGVERKVDAGFIDILARDQHGILTVIELKAAVTRPESIAQILGYMGSLAEETNENVRGILIGADHHPRVVFAAKAVSNLVLKRYRYRFEFS